MLNGAMRASPAHRSFKKIDYVQKQNASLGPQGAYIFPLGQAAPY
jgi:hypothetical protein